MQDRIPWSKINTFRGNYTSPTFLNYRPCPICGNLQDKTLIIFDDFQFFSDSAREPKRITIREVQCQNCHAVYLNPCYSGIGFHYLFKEAGQSYGASEGRPEEQINWLSIHGLLEVGKVFLDAGCYDGRFLSKLPNYLHRIGVDIDATAIACGLKHYGSEGIHLIHGNFENFACPDVPDVITMFHVLEHLSDPFQVLCHLRSISHSETYLVIEVPVIEYSNTNDINGFFSVQHMTHFSLNSLSQLMKRAGWQIIEQENMSSYNGHRILAKPCDSCKEVVGQLVDQKFVFNYLSHWYGQLAKIEERIENWPITPRAVIWGGGLHTEFLYQVTSLFNRDLSQKYIIVDSDPYKQGKSWRGISIFSPEILTDINWDDCQLIISSYGSQEKILKAAATYGVPDTVIYLLYENIRVY